jgi:hypothetical protein
MADTIEFKEQRASRSVARDGRGAIRGRMVWKSIGGLSASTADIVEKPEDYPPLLAYNTSHPDHNAAILDSYDVSRDGTELLVTANFSSDRSYTFREQVDPYATSPFRGWAGSVTTETVKIPFSRRAQVEVTSGTTTDTVDYWELQEIDVLTAMRVHRRDVVVTDIEAAIAAMEAQHNKLHRIPNQTNGRWYRFESGGYEQGEGGVATKWIVHYSWIYDPGHTSVAFNLGNDDIDLPPTTFSALVPAMYPGVEWLRPPFHQVIPIPFGVGQPFYYDLLLPYDVGGTNGNGWTTLPGLT